MRPVFHHPLLTRLQAAWSGQDLNLGPENNKGGRLRSIVGRVAHSPVFGMDIVEGRWWANTAWGYHPVSWYLQRAKEAGRKI